MEMLAAIAPAVELRPSDTANAPDRVRHPLNHQHQRRCELRRTVVEAIVLSRLEDSHKRQTARPEDLELPLVVSPDHESIRILALHTRPPTDLTSARRLRQHRLSKRNDLHVPLERKER